MLEKMINENSMNNLPSQLIYKMGERLISRENFLHMLKENGEKMDDKEIGDILKVLFVILILIIYLLCFLLIIFLKIFF